MVRPVRSIGLLAVALALVAAAVVVVEAISGGKATVVAEPSAYADSGTEPSRTVEAAGRAAHAPRSPRRVCGRAVLKGPSNPPRGAVVVTPARSLPTVVNNHGANTTFYLTAGTHYLGSGRFTQVRPKNGSTFIGAPGAVIDGRHDNLYAFAGHATNVTISYLTIQNFGTKTSTQSEGVVNHDAGTGWRIEHNTVRRNGGAGVFIGDHNVVRGNCLVRNGQYGFSVYKPNGVRNIKLIGNEIARNNTADWEQRVNGCGCTGGGKFWETRNAVVRGNYVHHNNGAGLWADTNNTGFRFEKNYIEANSDVGIFYETSYNARIVANTLVRNAVVDGPKAGFPQSAIYISESGGDKRAGGRYAGALLIGGNRFVDNYSSVALWENPDRFAGSPANSSSGYTTLVNPKVASLRNCSNPNLISTKPYLDDCRWKTTRVTVRNNVFIATENAPRCADCRFVGVFSNYGSYPSWSPYQGYVVPEAITFHQRNVFKNNTYRGPARFMAYQLGDRVTWRTWRKKFGQDKGSVYIR